MDPAALRPDSERVGNFPPEAEITLMAGFHFPGAFPVFAVGAADRPGKTDGGICFYRKKAGVREKIKPRFPLFSLSLAA